MVSSSTPQDRRKFMRILFDSPVTLRCNNALFESQLLDLSIKGALVVRPNAWEGQVGNQLILHIPLDADRHQIEMKAEISRIEEDRLGLQCIEIDVDSITELRRLVELNLGDEELLERELEALSWSD